MLTEGQVLAVILEVCDQLLFLLLLFLLLNSRVIYLLYFLFYQTFTIKERYMAQINDPNEA